MSHTETDQKQPTQKTMLERLLPVFTRKLTLGANRDCMDLRDEIPENAYKDSGNRVMAIDPDNGSIHSICYGTEDGSPVIFEDENSEKIFHKFAADCSAEGYIPVQCMFANWCACFIDLYYVDEYYDGFPFPDEQ